MLWRFGLRDESGRRQLSSRGAETRRLIESGGAPPHSKSKKNQAGLADRPVLLATDFVSNYAVRVLRRRRIVLAPNGSSSNAPAIIVVGSGTSYAPTVIELISTLPLSAPSSPT